LIGKKLAHYAITGKLGEGGMGVVYEAIDGRLDRAVALKLLPHDAVANPARKLRFVQEAKAASALNHPHIITIYDIGCDDGTDYIAMELIRGRTLEQALAGGKLKLPDALKYGAQIADALAAAHAAGIVHRDLKPGNIMITERGDVKVLDFGLAKLTDPTDISEDDETRTERAKTEEGSVVGSAPYMSPEQAEGRKVDARSDIFSFGSVLYEMLTGRRAFSGKTRLATMAAVLNSEPEPVSKLVPDMPREVERCVTRCLRKDLDRRSQSMAEIRVALQDLKEESESGSLATAAVPAGVAGSTAEGPPLSRKPRWVYAAAGVLCVAVLAAFWFLGPGRPAAPLHATVLTSFVGYQGAPSLSPDGNQFAFAWDGDAKNGPTHVYISLVGKGTPLRLTQDNENALYPAWSPDGQSIAYVVGVAGPDQPRELRVMPALGGPGRTIAKGRVWGPSWSPDSKWLVWHDYGGGVGGSSIYVAPSSGGEPRKLLEPPGADAYGGDIYPAFSPDGRQLVFSRLAATYDADLYLADFADGLLAGKPRQLTHDHNSKSNPLWSNDGKEVFYIAGEATSELSIYRVSAAGGEPRPVEGIGANANFLTLARKSNRLIYSTLSTNYDIHRLDLTVPDSQPERFLSSTRYEGSPSYSPDGKRIAFTSNRGGVRQIWVADADGANASPLTSFSAGVAGSPKWSPDGQFIVFDARPQGNSDVYTVPSGGGPVKRLTNNPAEDHVPFWSKDNWIYFGSTRVTPQQVFRMRPDGSAVQQITRDGGEYGEVSPDGKWLYYSAPGKGLRKMPPDGGEATQFQPPASLNQALTWTMGADGIYAIGTRRPGGFPAVYYPFDGGEPRAITTLSRAPSNFPAVSPDGHWFLYSNADDPVYGIMLVENFR
jgi:Tol biopolymer transport system component/predicted Ser/Thr protein kinase